MKKLYSPKDEAELAIIRGLLDGEKIHYSVHNDHFGSLRIGPKIDLFNANTIMVSEDDFERSQVILSDYLHKVSTDIDSPLSEYSIFDKIRMVFETILFSWFIPGKKWSRKKFD